MRCQFVRRKPELVRNLRRLYTQADSADIQAGIEWYPKAHAIMLDWADTYSVSIATVACVVAAISPQCDWARNLIIADDVLAQRYPTVGGALPANVRKARQILTDRATDITRYFPHGPKVASFAVNLAGDWQWPTIDTHAMQAALNDVRADYRLRWTPYRVFADCYREASYLTPHAPATFQAILWHTWKRLNPPQFKRQRRGSYWVDVETE